MPMNGSSANRPPAPHDPASAGSRRLQFHLLPPQPAAAQPEHKPQHRQEHAVPYRRGEDLLPHASVTGVGAGMRPLHRQHEGDGRAQQRSQIESASRRATRLPRKQPEQRAQDQEPGQKQDQRQVDLDQRTHAPSAFAAAFAASAASSVSSAARTSEMAASPVSDSSGSAPSKLSRRKAAIFCPASRGDANPTLCSSTRSPTDSLK